MLPKITAEQREALAHSNGPVPVEDEQTHHVYYLLDPATLETLQRAEDLAAICTGLADADAGRVMPLEELDQRVRDCLGLSRQE